MSENPYKYESDLKEDSEQEKPVGLFYDTVNFIIPFSIIILTPGVPLIVGNTLNYGYSMAAWIGIAWPFSIYILYKFYKGRK